MARGKGRGKSRKGRRTGRGRKITLAGMVAAIAVLAFSGWHYYNGTPLPDVHTVLPGASALPFPAAADPAEQVFYVATVLRVVDGDTLVVLLNGRTERVRLLCVDTPESVHPQGDRNGELGKTAAQYTRERLASRQVRLACPQDGERDRFGRLLATVFIEDENFNVTLVRDGMSPYYTEYGRSPYYDGEFRSAEAQAKREHRGVWARDEVALGHRVGQK